jgi:hypothetical protein
VEPGTIRIAGTSLATARCPTVGTPMPDFILWRILND